MADRAVFWDFDGTLAASSPLWSRCMLEALTELIPDTHINPDELRANMMGKYPWDTPYDDHTKHIGAAFWSCLEAAFADAYTACGVDSHIAVEAAGLVRGLILRPQNYRVYDDAIFALRAAKALGYGSYLLSNNFPELPALAAQLGLDEYLDGCIVSGIEGYDKPRAELFNIAAMRAGEPEIRIMVGDNPYADAAGGKNAGMITVLVRRCDESAADYTFAELSGLREVLLKFAAGPK